MTASKDIYAEQVNFIRMINFAKQFSDRKIVSTLSRQLSWFHFVNVCSIEEMEKSKREQLADNLKRVLSL